MDYYRLYEDRDYDNPWWDEDGLEMETIYCPTDAGHQRGGPRLSKLNVIFQSRKLQDVMWTVYSECIITDKVAQLLRKNELSGYSLRPVDTKYKKGVQIATDIIPQYWELLIHGWGGMAKPSSGIHLKSECKSCGHMVYSAIKNPINLLDTSQWDGSDFFMIWPLPRYIFVTESLKNVFDREQVTGCKFIFPEDMPYGPEYNLLGTLSPGRLRQWMPEERARELGEPLGIY